MLDDIEKGTGAKQLTLTMQKELLKLFKQVGARCACLPRTCLLPVCSVLSVCLVLRACSPVLMLLLQIDRDGSGTISYKELKLGLEKEGFPIAQVKNIYIYTYKDPCYEFLK